MIPTFDSMDESLLSVLRHLLRDGEEVAPRRIKTRELTGYTFRLSNPRARRIALPARAWKESLAVGEFCWHLAGSDSVDFVAYYAPVWQRFSEDGARITSSCYGRRIFGGASPTQWDRAHNALSYDAATRRAVLNLADAAANPVSAVDVSCITSIQFLLRDDRLDCITTMRSCDVIWGLCYDVYFCTMLQELMASRLGTEVGWYQHAAGSLHLYEHMMPMATEIVAEGLIARADPMPPLTMPESVPAFLAAEAALRERRPEATAKLQALPPYWRMLASPLEKLHRVRRTAVAKEP